MLPTVGIHQATAGRRSLYRADSGVLVFAIECIIDEAHSIVSNQSLTRKDGTVNERGVRTLREVFGWDGTDPFWLVDNDLSQHPFEIDCQDELDQKGQPRVTVKWLNPVGASGGMKPCGDRAAILAQYGSMFRAVAGGATVAPRAPGAAPAAPRAPSTGPSAPRAPSRPPAPAPSTPPATPPAKPSAKPSAPSSQAEAWAAFEAAAPSDWDNAKVELEWFAALKRVTGKADPASLSPDDWGKVVADMGIIPF
jgi:hypothetical protein